MISWIDKLNDSLLSGAEWTGKNFKTLAVVLAVLLVIGAVWAGLHHSNTTKSEKALLAYAPIERDFTDWKTPPPPNPATKEAPAPKNIDPNQLFTRMLEYIKTQGDVPASQLMSLMAGEVAAQLGPEKETELLDVAQKTFKAGSQLMDGLVQIKKGDLLANQDKCDEALKAWKDVLSNKRLSYLHDVTRLKSGLCLEKLSKFPEAEAFYDQIINASKSQNNEAQKTAQMMRQNQWAVKEAQKLKRALKWSQKQPSS